MEYRIRGPDSLWSYGSSVLTLWRSTQEDAIAAVALVCAEGGRETEEQRKQCAGFFDGAWARRELQRLLALACLEAQACVEDVLDSPAIWVMWGDEEEDSR